MKFFFNFRVLLVASFFLMIPFLCQADTIVLTETSSSATITASSDMKVYGTAGANHVTLENGAKAQLFNFPGSNTITIQADSSSFTVSRSGAIVTFDGTDGTFLKMPATTTSQKIEFNDTSMNLVIENNKVLLGNQEVTVNGADDNGATQEIGPEGGIIESDNGIKLVVATGNLSAPEVISIEKIPATKINGEQLTSDDKVLLSAVNFSPDGLVFNTPVTVTFPLEFYVTPGTSLPVFLYDEDSGNFIDEGIMGIVGQDGFSCIAEIQHFSNYVVAASMSSPESQMFKFKLYGTNSDDQMFSHVYFDKEKREAFIRLVNYMRPKTPFPYQIEIRNYENLSLIKKIDANVVAGEYLDINITDLMIEKYEDKHITLFIKARRHFAPIAPIAPAPPTLDKFLCFLDWNNDYENATIAKLVLKKTIQDKKIIDNSFVDEKGVENSIFVVDKSHSEDHQSLNTTTHRVLDFDKIITRKINYKSTKWELSEYALNMRSNILSSSWEEDDLRIPLLLIHGWQGAIGKTVPAHMLTYENNEFEYWHNFISYYITTPKLYNAYKLYTYKYPSYKHITFNARMLDNLLVQLKDDNDTVIGKALGIYGKGIVIMGHSMGGLVSRSMVEEHKKALGENAEKLIKLITLDTPHHGSPSILSSYVRTELADVFAKDLQTAGAVDLMWDNYDGNYKHDDYHYISAISELDGDSRFMRLGDSGAFDKSYPLGSQLNPWLGELNDNFERKSDVYSDKYIFYVAHSAPDMTNNDVSIYNSIRNDNLMFLNTTFINDRGYASGGAEPVCSAFLSKSDKVDDVTRFDPHFGTINFPHLGKPEKFIDINNLGHENNYNIPYRVFWDYNHERIMNGVYIEKGDWDQYIDEDINYSVHTCYATNFKSIMPYGCETVSDQYMNTALAYLNHGTNTTLIANVDNTNSESRNPLKTEPVFLVMQKDLLDALDSNTETYYRDSDGDGYGDPDVSYEDVSQLSGYVTDNTDCDDSDADVNSGVSEVCGDDIDNNCNGEINEDCQTWCNELKWPINCIPGDTCIGDIGYPDINSDGKAFNCGTPGYTGHQGTDISAQRGTSVYAAFSGEVLWVFDGKFDGCPSNHPDCQAPPSDWFEAGQSNGYRVCTPKGPFCGTGTGNCFWCFDGGNVIVIKHPDNTHVFATRYDHLKTNSIVVSAGDLVVKGQKIAEIGSSGNSSGGAHLHFEVWGTGFYELADPWAGACGPNYETPLWENGNTPWGN